MTTTPRIVRDPEVLRSFLSDAAHVPGGFAAGVTMPSSVDEVVAVLHAAATVLPVGAQSSLTGGATPRGEVVMSLRGLTGIAIDDAQMRVRVGAGVTLHELQATLAERGLWYPPAPTFDGASVGGTVSTNAAGAATFKYGTTRDWVEALTVVLANGRVLSLRRGDVVASAGGFLISGGRQDVHVPLPTYVMPHVAKLSAGYFARPGMDLVDLFVGSEGTLGVITDATLRVVPRPTRAVALVRCLDDGQASRLTAALSARARLTWRGDDVLDVSAVEYMDSRSLAFLPDAALAATQVARPTGRECLLLVQVEVRHEIERSFSALDDTLTACAITADPILAAPGDDTGAARLFNLREAVPAEVNAAVGRARAAEPTIQKTAGDFVVPVARLEDSIAAYRTAFESRGLDYAIWGHASDGNLHPNVIPHTREQMALGQEALLESARAAIAMGGAPLAEHGVGRSPLKRQLLRELYGDEGVAAMRAVKRILDPACKLSPGVLFDTW